jgi:hypothetical protein
MRCDSWASLLACTLASPDLGREPKVRVATLALSLVMGASTSPYGAYLASIGKTFSLGHMKKFTYATKALALFTLTFKEFNMEIRWK